MNIDLYIGIILLIFFIVMILAMIFFIHSGNVFASLLACFISCIVALIAVTPVIFFDTPLASTSTSQISVQEISKISPKDNSDTLFNITYKDTEDINRRIIVKEIVYDSDITYIEKTRKTFLFLYKDSYVLHEPQGFINNN